MYISKLKIKNFKCFQDVEIIFDPNFNLIIGENNSGKSTIFDALRLWQLAFKRFLKDRTNNNKQSSFYASQFCSFTIDDISFLRIINFSNLFKKKENKKFEISITILSGVEIVTIPIIFSKTTEGQVLKFELCKQTSDRLLTSEHLSKISNKHFGADFKKLFLFTYINPIFLLPTNEPQHSNGYILNKLHEAKANEVIRNMIYLISPEKKTIKKEKKKEKLIEIENSLKEILQIQDISFSKRLEKEESYIKIFSKNEVLNTEVEINQLGSGTINILNILSVLAYGDYENFSLNVLLLDEPDSHLHFNHQSRLFDFLKKISENSNKQTFTITHNSSLISESDKVLFIKNDVKSIKPITFNDYLESHLKNIDENHYDVMKKLHKAKKEKEDIEKQLSNYTKPVIYCEGITDVKILKQAYLILYKEHFFKGKFDIENKGGASKVASALRDNQSKNNLCLVGILDNDSAGQTEINKVCDNHNFTSKDKIYYTNQSNNSHLLLLPIPEFRLESADFFKKNTIIEYLFTDETLENKLKIQMIKSKGETFKKINDETKDSDKNIISTNIEKLELETNDFKHFIPLFEKIAEIISYQLPAVNFDN